MSEYIGAELHGPFVSKETFALSYEGKRIPFVNAEIIDGDYWVRLDDRMVFGKFTEQELLNILPLLANCMAFSAGYPCFGTDKKYEQFNCTINRVVMSGKPTLVHDADKKDT